MNRENTRVSSPLMPPMDEVAGPASLHAELRSYAYPLLTDRPAGVSDHVNTRH